MINFGKYTFRLFSPPSLVEGMGRIFDVAGSLNQYNQSATTEEEDDKQALYSDWCAVGGDIKTAIEQYGKQ